MDVSESSVTNNDASRMQHLTGQHNLHSDVSTCISSRTSCICSPTPNNCISPDKAIAKPQVFVNGPGLDRDRMPDRGPRGEDLSGFRHGREHDAHDVGPSSQENSLHTNNTHANVDIANPEFNTAAKSAVDADRAVGTQEVNLIYIPVKPNAPGVGGGKPEERIEKLATQASRRSEFDPG